MEVKVEQVKAVECPAAEAETEIQVDAQRADRVMARGVAKAVEKIEKDKNVEQQSGPV